MEKKTPLFDWHGSNGGKMIPFGGFLLPVQYETGIITEHCAVREKAGLFDVSHMGEFVIRGAGALEAIQILLTNDFSNMQSGRVRYSVMCNEQGGIIDDLVVYKMDEERYMLVVNAANREKDASWIKSRIGNALFEDLSDSFGQIALQGPASPLILARVSETIPEKYYTFIEKGKAAGLECIISQTGYTGETGFEMYCRSQDTEALWKALLAAGMEAGLVPCGLGARDTLRFEASMPLYGHEMDETVNPFEAGLAFAVKMTKGDFYGKTALEAYSANTRAKGRIRTGLVVTGRGIIREQCPVYYQGKSIGITTSGTFCPHLKKAHAMAMLSAEHSEPGIKVEADVRGKMVPAETCSMPFYKKKST